MDDNSLAISHNRISRDRITTIFMRHASVGVALSDEVSILLVALDVADNIGLIILFNRKVHNLIVKANLVGVIVVSNINLTSYKTVVACCKRTHRQADAQHQHRQQARQQTTKLFRLQHIITPFLTLFIPSATTGPPCAYRLCRLKPLFFLPQGQMPCGRYAGSCGSGLTVTGSTSGQVSAVLQAQMRRARRLTPCSVFIAYPLNFQATGKYYYSFVIAISIVSCMITL